ncbi:MAG: C10 family peptidase [Planctomycetota bacterium]|jgi:hypothetical protein
MKRNAMVLTTVLVLLGICCSRLWAGPTTAQQAQKAVTGWLRADPQPLGAALGQQVSRVEAFTDEAGDPLYYIVYLEPSGFVIVPADDLVEPIIGFVEEGLYDPSEDNPLGALVTKDLNGRVAAARDSQSLQAAGAMESALAAQAEWEQLQGWADGVGILGIGSVSDPRVDPLVTSKWDQRTVCDPARACYNYYTPPGAAGSTSNYPCGCVATAMAQVMRYHQHPTGSVGTSTFWIEVNGSLEQRALRGGPYNWNAMPSDPELCCDWFCIVDWDKETGAICHDAGVAISWNPDYTDYTSSGTGAYTKNVPTALRDTFQYARAVKGYNSGSNIPKSPNLNGMMNPGLDGGYPSILSIKRSGGGHAVVCDGYGYDSVTLYHHLNMGWGGSYDAWYNLPTVDAYYTYTLVKYCIYNIFPSYSGEIISGRVLKPDGTAIAGADVFAEGGMLGYHTQTNSRGIYALVGLDSSTAYRIWVENSGCCFPERNETTGQSVDDGAMSGNLWGIDFVAEPPVITSILPTSGPAGTYMKIEGLCFCDTAGSVIFAGGAAGDILAWSDTLILCRVPGGAASGNMIVRTALGADSNPVYFEVTNPTTIYVDDDYTPNVENGTLTYPFSTIQRGIDAATTADTVIVADGTYTGVGNRDIEFLGKAITVRSGDPYDPAVVAATVVDCQGLGRGFYINSGEGRDSLLAGLTITNGYESTGGGIYTWNTSPTISRCVITHNAAEYGGGIDCTLGDPTIVNCAITYNDANLNGGGVHCVSSEPNIVNCIIRRNEADVGDGGGMLSNYSRPTLVNCLFHENSAVDAGGGMSNYNASFATVVNCTFVANLASVGGAVHSEFDSHPTLTNCILWDDVATSGNGPEIAVMTTANPAQLTISYSAVKWGQAGAHVESGCTLNWDASNTQADPQLAGLLVPSMISCWKLDEGSGETAFDCVGGMHGNLISGPVWTTGQANRALSFDGLDDWVFTPLYPPMGNSARAVTLWAKTASAQHMIATGYGSRDYGGSFRTSFNWTCPGVTIDISYGAITYTATVNDDEWHSYAWVVPEGATRLNEVKVYMDGVLLTTEGCYVTRTRLINTQPVYAFTMGTFASESRFEGTLDEIAVFERGLTAGEIQQIYQKGLAGHGLVDYRLLSGSPCIDAGNNMAVPADAADLDDDGDRAERTPLDLDNGSRFIDDPGTVDTGLSQWPDYPYVVDMGAYESLGSTCWNPLECVGQPDGDATCDGNVNLADLFALKEHFGKSAPWTKPECCADFTRDGSINLADLFALKAGFGSGPYSPSTLEDDCPP